MLQGRKRSCLPELTFHLCIKTWYGKGKHALRLSRELYVLLLNPYNASQEEIKVAK